MGSFQGPSSPKEQATIDLAAEDEISFWTKRFETNAKLLTKVVRIVGPRPRDVARFLHHLRQA
jgi:hypothetical protein